MELQPDRSIITRYSLLSRLQDWQDNKSWQEFFETYWRLVYSVALRSGLTEMEAQEVVQETFICVAKSIHEFRRDRSKGSFKGWLRNLTRWRIADQLRKRTRGAKAESPTPTEDATNPEKGGGEDDAEWDLEWKESLLKSAIERVKGRVNAEHFQIFDLYAVRGWPVRKVAQVLSVSVPMVYLAKHRVTAMIKREVEALEKGEQLRLQP
ncbi:MAG TPA: sigma-70 family RNA polymerase sigma factor [Verrucomicrobiae bacterium]|jgi:RNA polymerase sigma-70 factor (ECF subfamily)